MTQVNLTLKICIVALAGLCTACYEPETSFSANTYSGPVNRCAHVDECAPGNLCDEELGICVATGVEPESKHYYVKIIPKAIDEIPDQVFEIALPAVGAQTTVLSVREPVEVSLVIKTLNEEGQELPLELDFMVEITRFETSSSQVEVPGTSPHVSVFMIPHQSAQPDLSDPDDEGFVVKLLPGSIEERKYNLKIVPQDGTLWRFPPMYYDGVIVTDVGEFVHNGMTLGSLDVRKASQEVEDKEIVLGTVSRGGENVENLTVVARDRLTDRLLSTESTTDENGAFKIGIPAGVEEFTLVASKPNTLWYPSIEMEYDTGSDLENVLITGDALAHPVLYAATFEKEEFYGVSNCLVIFEHDFDDGNGNQSHVLRSAYTNVAGEVSVYLYPTWEPEEYSVTVIPPPSGDLAQHELDVFYGQYAISADSVEGDTYLLEQRSHIQGSVSVLIDDTPELVPAGLVRAYPIKDLPSYSRTSLASVESNGEFNLWVDTGDYNDADDPDTPEAIGEYRLVVEAPAQSWYAWGSYSQHSGNAEFVEINTPIPFTSTLDLQLVSESGNSAEILGGAVVEVYEEVKPYEYLPGQLIMVGRSVASQDARVLLLLEP